MHPSLELRLAQDLDVAAGVGVMGGVPPEVNTLALHPIGFDSLMNNHITRPCRFRLYVLCNTDVYDFVLAVFFFSCHRKIVVQKYFGSQASGLICENCGTVYCTVLLCCTVLSLGTVPKDWIFW